MRSPIYRNLWILATGVLQAGCGAMLQSAHGFSETSERPAQRTRRVRIEGLSDNATVVRQSPGESMRPVGSRTDELTYDVLETVEIPKSRSPMYLGTVLGAAGATGVLYADSQREESSDYLRMMGVAMALGALADLAFSAVYTIDTEPVVIAVRPAKTATVTYVATLGDDTQRASLNPASADRVRFDFDGPRPGGPRLGAVGPEPPAPPSPAPPAVQTTAPEPEEIWYGWQLAALDTLALVGVIGGIANEDTKLIAGGVTLYGLGAPVVHLANGRLFAGGISLAVRAVGPFAGAIAGGIAGIFAIPFVDCGTDDLGLCPVAVMFTGAVVGTGTAVIAAMVIDAALALKTREQEPIVEPTSLLVLPTASLTNDGRPTFGLAGRF